MSNIVNEGSKKEFYLVPSGTHQAVCYAIWDLGRQKTTYKGEELVMHKKMLAFEINDEMPSGEFKGKRPCVFKRYTASLNEKALLRKDLESWRGKALTSDELKGFELDNLVGINCMVSIIHNVVGDKIYANISSVSKLMKGLTALVPENIPAMPEWVVKIKDKAIVDECEHAEAVEVEEAIEEIPF